MTTIASTATTSASPLLVSVEEAAALLNVSAVSIRRWVASGRLPATRMSRRVFLHRDIVQSVARNGVERQRAY